MDAGLISAHRALSFMLLPHTTWRMRNVYNIIKHTSRAPQKKKQTREEGEPASEKIQFACILWAQKQIIDNNKEAQAPQATRRGLVWPMAKKGGGLDHSGRAQSEIKRERGAGRRGGRACTLWKQQSLRLSLRPCAWLRLRLRLRLELFGRRRKCEWCWWWADGDRTAQRTVAS